MRMNVLLSAMAAAASLTAVVPATASAQSYGGYGGPGYSGYGYSDRGYDAPRYDDRRAAWAVREQRREWKDHQRWERQEARRYRHHDYRGEGYGYGYDRY